jgi:hypothetical protein
LLQVTAIVEEYFSSGDVSNAADSLSELGPVESMGHYFVKRLVTLALDRKDKEREMASSLLSNLYAEVRLVFGYLRWMLPEGHKHEAWQGRRAAALLSTCAERLPCRRSSLADCFAA